MEHKYKLGMYEKAAPEELTWDQRFTAVKESGYDYIELSIDESDKRMDRLNWTDSEIRKLSESAFDHGISIGSICFSAQRRFPFGLDSSVPLELMRKAINFAAQAGIPIIQLAGYDVYYEQSTPDTLRRFKSNLAIATEMAAKDGIIIAFETMETPFMDTVGKAMKYVAEINSPYLQVYPDIGNLNNAAIKYKTSISDDINSGMGHIAAAHIKETEPGKYRNMLFGTGCVDFKTLLSQIYSLGVRRYVTEMWYLGSPNWKTDIINAVTFARSILDSEA